MEFSSGFDGILDIEDLLKTTVRAIRPARGGQVFGPIESHH